MAVLNQLAGTYLLDIPVHNFTGSTLVEGAAVILDTANPASTTFAAGVTLPASSAKPFGFLPSAIASGKSGVARVYGVSVANPTVGVSLAAGDVLMQDSTGSVLLATAANPQIGIAMSAVTTAVAGDKVLVLIDRAKNA